MSFFKTTLRPASFLYSGVMFIRNSLYDLNFISTYRSQLHVISVGNITAGGSGKTPFARMLAEKLTTAGLKPVILLRGYKGSEIGPKLVSREDSFLKVGDEALEHSLYFSGKVPIVVSRNRVDGAKFIEKGNLGDLIILDDGFQHRKLERDLDFVLIDGSTELASKSILENVALPAGRLRESVNQAKKRASQFIFIERGSAQLNQELVRKLIPSNERAVTLKLSAGVIVDVFSGEVVSRENISSTVGLITAIANPESFVEMIKAKGFVLGSKQIFSDHYRFSKSDWDKARQIFSGAFVTTMKDAVKLKNFVREPGELFALTLDCSFATDEMEKNVIEQVMKSVPRL